MNLRCSCWTLFLSLSLTLSLCVGSRERVTDRDSPTPPEKKNPPWIMELNYEELKGGSLVSAAAVGHFTSTSALQLILCKQVFFFSFLFFVNTFYMHAYMYVCRCLYISTRLYMCICVYISFLLIHFTCMHICMYVYMSIFKYTFIHVYLCVGVRNRLEIFGSR